jgi:hypothetical protein
MDCDFQALNERIGDLSFIEKEDLQGQTRISASRRWSREDLVFSSIRCDNKLANGSSRFKEIVGLA